MTEQADAHNEVTHRNTFCKGHLKAVRVPFEDKLSYNKHFRLLKCVCSMWVRWVLPGLKMCNEETEPTLCGNCGVRCQARRAMWDVGVFSLEIR
jgi:hypothetical protein